MRCRPLSRQLARDRLADALVRVSFVRPTVGFRVAAVVVSALRDLPQLVASIREPARRRRHPLGPRRGALLIYGRLVSATRGFRALAQRLELVRLLRVSRLAASRSSAPLRALHAPRRRALRFLRDGFRDRGGALLVHPLIAVARHLIARGSSPLARRPTPRAPSRQPRARLSSNAGCTLAFARTALSRTFAASSFLADVSALVFSSSSSAIDCRISSIWSSFSLSASRRARSSAASATPCVAGSLETPNELSSPSPSDHSSATASPGDDPSGEVPELCGGSACSDMTTRVGVFRLHVSRLRSPPMRVSSEAQTGFTIFERDFRGAEKEPKVRNRRTGGVASSVTTSTMRTDASELRCIACHHSCIFAMSNARNNRVRLPLDEFLHEGLGLIGATLYFHPVFREQRGERSSFLPKLVLHPVAQSRRAASRELLLRRRDA